MILEELYQGRTLVLGHRGAKAYAPMNTIPAFKLALEQGADGIELDTHLTKDGHLIVLHDFTVDHTTNGQGYVKDMTLAEVKSLDAGSYFDAKFAGTRIPTLDEVFEAIGQRTFINVEIKSETIRTDGVEKAVADCITRHAMSKRVIVSSFNPLALRRFRQVMPTVPIGYLYSSGISLLAPVMYFLPHEARHPLHSMIDATYVQWAHKNNWRVNTWTVNDPAQAVELHNFGVDAIITDSPDVMIEALRG
jgi:glycerophosphoryl diester phosphodiesterase